MFLINFAARLTPKTRVTSYYFFQAMSVGVVNSFAGIWFASQGISEEQIGLITASPLLAVLLVGILVGRIADRAPDWRHVIVVGAGASGLVPLALIITEGFWGILIVWTLTVTTQMTVGPIVDAASIRLGRRVGFDFSLLYAWKTIGYMVTIFIVGFVIAELGVAAFLPLFICLSLVRAVASFGLPNFRAPGHKEKKRFQTGRLSETTQLWFVLPLIAWSLVHCTHFVLNGFLGLIWQAQGVSENMIGALIAVSALGEIAMFFGFKRFADRFSARTLILVSCLIAVIRWAALAFSPSVSFLFVLQLLHALTYALGFLACTNFIANWTNEDVAAEAQSFFAILQSGVAIFALVTFGWLASAFGAYAFLASAGLAAVGALLVTISMILTKKRNPVR